MIDLNKTAAAVGLTPEEARKALRAAGKRKHSPPKPAQVMYVADVAKALGVTARSLRRRLLRRGGIIYKDDPTDPNEQWKVTLHDLRVAFPRDWMAVQMAKAAEPS